MCNVPEVCTVCNNLTINIPSRASHIVKATQLLFLIFLFRKAGDEWLVTSEDVEMYIPEVSEVKINVVANYIPNINALCLSLNVKKITYLV